MNDPMREVFFVCVDAYAHSREKKIYSPRYRPNVTAPTDPVGGLIGAATRRECTQSVAECLPPLINRCCDRNRSRAITLLIAGQTVLIETDRQSIVDHVSVLGIDRPPATRL